jgi:hypothetical protein
LYKEEGYSGPVKIVSVKQSENRDDGGTNRAKNIIDLLTKNALKRERNNSKGGKQGGLKLIKK